MTDLANLIRYELLAGTPIAQQGQGAVWKARDLLFDEIVALKEIRADLTDDPAAAASFKKEAAAGARLGRISPNIVKVNDYGKINNTFYFAMEWIEGGNLLHRCGSVSLPQAKSIILQVCHALRTAHRHSIVHSDIAPANILYDKAADCYKLADFGYLKILDSILISRGESLLIGGRTYYLPPEKLRSPEKINTSTDVYALALTFHYLLTRETLHSDSSGYLRTPGVIHVRHDNKSAPDQVRQLIERFVEGHRDTDNVDDLRIFLERIP